MNTILRLPYNLIRPVYEKTSFHKSVIEEITAPGLRLAYSHCRKITREYAKTFYFATRFLPNKKQRSIFAIYALCRHIDDLVDETEDLLDNKQLSLEEVRTKIESWKNDLKSAYSGEESNHPVLIAISDVLNSYYIPIDLPLELIEGVSMDLTKKRYQTFDELYTYCYKVASVVGLMTSEVFGYTDKKALEYAESLGIAMQLTNILRDVGEDLRRGRVYIPQEELDHFGVTEESLFNHKCDDNFKNLMKFQIERANFYYSEANKGIKLLSKDSRYPVALASINYNRILEKITENDYQVFSKRAYLSSYQKMKVLPKVWLGNY